MKKQVSQLNVAGKKVLVRVDFNVPHKGEVISDDNRIAAAVPTIVELLNKGAKVVLMSHLGKIKWGKVDDAEIEKEKRANDLKIAIEPLKKHLKNALGKDVSVSFSEETRGESLKANYTESFNVALKENYAKSLTNTINSLDNLTDSTKKILVDGYVPMQNSMLNYNTKIKENIASILKNTALTEE